VKTKQFNRQENGAPIVAIVDRLLYDDHGHYAASEIDENGTLVISSYAPSALKLEAVNQWIEQRDRENAAGPSLAAPKIAERLRGLVD
jgi:hypothetical protein